MGKLYPPHIENILPAFYDQDNKITIKIPFIMNKAVSKGEGEEQWNGQMKLMIKTISSGTILGEFTSSEVDEAKGIATFILSENDKKKFVLKQFYKFQLAYLALSKTGYYSTIGIAKYVAAPGEINLNCYNNSTCIATYSVPVNDPLEKLYSYCFDIIQEENGQEVLIATSGEQVHNTEADVDNEQYDTWDIPVIISNNCKLKYHAKTMNNLELTTKTIDLIVKQPEESLVDCDLKALLSAEMDNENGIVIVKIKPRSKDVYLNNYESFASTNLTGSFVLSRKTNKLNVWQELMRFSVNHTFTGADDCIILQKDYTIECGVEYTYGLQFFRQDGENQVYSTHILNYEGPQYADFEDAFLYDGEKQLCIKYNPKISSFKTVKLESKINTIGSKYPFIFRNGNTDYKEFQISGLLSALSDPDNQFHHSSEPAAADSLTPEYRFGDKDNNNHDRTKALKHIKPLIADTDLVSNNFHRERNFKLNVLNWLNNGKPKLFRSPGEGNYIVQIMNTSLSPIDTLGRMIHNFTCTASEVEDYTQINLKKYNTIYSKDIVILESNEKPTIENNDFQQYKYKTNYYGALQTTAPICGFNDKADHNYLNEILLNQSSIEQITFQTLSVYTIEYCYGYTTQSREEQFIDPDTGETIIITKYYKQLNVGYVFKKDNKIIKSESKFDGFDQSKDQTFLATLPNGIYHIYDRPDWDIINEYNTTEQNTILEEAYTYKWQTRFIYENEDPRIVEQIVPVSFLYQINMTKFPALASSSGESQSSLYVEDVYALYLGNGLVAKVKYKNIIS